jgi:purine nucleosidase/pyrimidine-specific ribonucleoside hydrolase
MKRKTRIIVGIVVGLLVLLFFLIGPGVPLLANLGVEPFCFQGEFPDLQVVQCPEEASAQPTVTLYPLPTLAQEVPIPIIFDDDGSPDGVIALIFFLRNPLYDVKAVTVSVGEAHPQLFAQHIAHLLSAFGRADIPVGYGRNTPLAGDNAFPEPWREGSDVFWDIPLSQDPASYKPIPAAELIVETISSSPEPMMVFVSGTHTNLAEAISLDPGIHDNILGVYVMGGSIYVEGNIESDWPEIHNRVAEWNIWVDPLAASEVFASGLPLHIIPLDATNQIVWTDVDAQDWLSSAIPETNMAGEILEWMLRSWSLDAAYIWDLVAAVAATDPNLCPEVHLALDVVLEQGSEQGQTIVDDEPANAWVCLDPVSTQIKLRVATILGQ